MKEIPIKYEYIKLDGDQVEFEGNFYCINAHQ